MINTHRVPNTSWFGFQYAGEYCYWQGYRALGKFMCEMCWLLLLFQYRASGQTHAYQHCTDIHCQLRKPQTISLPLKYRTTHHKNKYNRQFCIRDKLLYRRARLPDKILILPGWLLWSLGLAPRQARFTFAFLPSIIGLGLAHAFSAPSLSAIVTCKAENMIASIYIATTRIAIIIILRSCHGCVAQLCVPSRRHTY